MRNVGAPTAKEMEEILKEDEALRPLHRAAAKATKKRKDKKKMDRKRAREEAKKDDEGYETEGKKRVRTQD